jgi:hypothetical protein
MSKKEELDLLRSENFDGTIVPDKWYYFEIMDRTHMLCNHIETALGDHPGLDEEHAAMALQASMLIGEIYQWAGRKMDEVVDD